MTEYADAAAAPAAPPVSAVPPRHYRELPGPRAVPIFGNLHQVPRGGLHATLEQGAQRYGPMYRFRMGKARCLIVSDPDAVAQVLRARPDAYTRSPRVSDIIREMGLTGVFAAEGAEWRTQRMLVTRTFTPEVVRRFVPQMLTFVERLGARWQRLIDAGQAPDVARDLKATTLDVTVAMAMGETIDSLESDDVALQADVRRLFETAGRRTITPFAYWRHVRLPQDRRADAAVARVRERVRRLIDAARGRLGDGVPQGARPANLLDAMVLAAQEPGSQFTDEMLIGNAMTMIFAGEDTTAGTLAWALLLVAEHPGVARRLADEADRVLADGSGLTAARIDALSYAEAVLHEAMRLKPVAPMLPMCASHAQRLGDVLVPARTIVILLTRRSWQTGGQFERPQAFDPERWLQGDGLVAASDPNRKMMPFGGGPRLCPGRYLAMVEMKAILCLLAARFEWRFTGASSPAERLAFTMNPDAVALELTRRSPRPAAAP